MSTIAPLNAQTPVTEDPTGKPVGFATKYFRQWLQAVTDQVAKGATIVKTLSLLAQSAAIATETLFQTSGTGVFRITYYLRITTPATVSSSVTLTFGWLESTVAVTAAFAAVVGNSPTTVQSGSLLVRADATSNLTLAAAYASVGATPMAFRIDIVVEQVG